jgi:hypothetical protein
LVVNDLVALHLELSELYRRQGRRARADFNQAVSEKWLDFRTFLLNLWP